MTSRLFTLLACVGMCWAMRNGIPVPDPSAPANIQTSGPGSFGNVKVVDSVGQPYNPTLPKQQQQQQQPATGTSQGQGVGQTVGQGMGQSQSMGQGMGQSQSMGQGMGQSQTMGQGASQAQMMTMGSYPGQMGVQAMNPQAFGQMQQMGNPSFVGFPSQMAAQSQANNDYLSMLTNRQRAMQAINGNAGSALSIFNAAQSGNSIGATASSPAAASAAAQKPAFDTQGQLAMMTRAMRLFGRDSIENMGRQMIMTETNPLKQMQQAKLKMYEYPSYTFLRPLSKADPQSYAEANAYLTKAAGMDRLGNERMAQLIVRQAWQSPDPTVKAMAQVDVASGKFGFTDLEKRLARSQLFSKYRTAAFGFLS